MYLINAVASKLRSEGHIVLIVGSSALSATLYERGRTAHSLFRIPVKEVRPSHAIALKFCLPAHFAKDNVGVQSLIEPRTQRAELIRHASLIVWDELPMTNRAVFEAVDEVCRTITRSQAPFGAIPFVGLGDFRQVAPVVKGHGVLPVLQASVKSSPLWAKLSIFVLTHPIRSATIPNHRGRQPFSHTTPAFQGSN